MIGTITLWRHSRATWIPCLAAAGIACAGLAQASDTAPLTMAGKENLQQRVLTTPGCRLTPQPGGKPGEALPAFSRFYVYQRSEQDGDKWLKVGPDSYGNVTGWLPEDCTVDWKMQMTLAFTNPANRDRLMFFRQRDDLTSILDEFEPSSEVAPLRGQLEKDGQAPSVVAREPEYYVDLQEQFYLLPILEGEEIMTEAGFRTRLLKVASVSADEDVLDEAEDDADSSSNGSSQLREFNAGVVFVVDSTISMGPYIERTREAVRRVYGRLEEENLTDKVRFGMVSFRDSVEAAPDVEYTTRLFADPNETQNREDFMSKVASLEEATASTQGWEEDAYAGVMQAVDDINWGNFGARYVVMITDASAVEGDNPRSATGFDADQVRLEAARQGIAVYTLYLQTPEGKERGDNVTADTQYGNLSTFTGTNTSLYYPVDASNLEMFGQRVDALANAITGQVHSAYMGDEAIGSTLNAEPSADTQAGNTGTEDSKAQKMREDTELVGHAMQLAYLGQRNKTQAPPVFNAWISDRDLIKQNVPTTEVRVLLTKGQLSDLSDVVSEILHAANTGLISPADMFEQLRSVAAATGTDPNQVSEDSGRQLGEMGLMGEYLKDLPYQSEVLNLDEATWSSWNGLQQERFIRGLTTKLRHYQRYNEDVDRWISLAPDADARDNVYPVPLEMLP
ncbi:vWA domain-containing protein [Vreelandella jeotgali]|uniref:vWA domain-containing protein n=1 Tax=Vreelandella jeotgali TaxID=553386 RepID=UPI00034A3001|nr:vWA domain-containing protein [Halomonas jeotgali]